MMSARCESVALFNDDTVWLSFSEIEFYLTTALVEMLFIREPLVSMQVSHRH